MPNFGFVRTNLLSLLRLATGFCVLLALSLFLSPILKEKKKYSEMEEEKIIQKMDKERKNENNMYIKFILQKTKFRRGACKQFRCHTPKFGPVVTTYDLSITYMSQTFSFTEVYDHWYQ